MLPERGTWMLSTTLSGTGDAPAYQFGFKVLDGGLIAQFVFDHSAGFQYNYPHVTPEQRGDTWVMVFPTGDFDVADSHHWEATLNVAGEDVKSLSGDL